MVLKTARYVIDELIDFTALFKDYSRVNCFNIRNCDDLVQFERLNDDQRAWLISGLQEQFTEECAVALYDRGFPEEKHKLLPGPINASATDTNNVDFTSSAHADWLFLWTIVKGEMLGALTEGLAALRSGQHESGSLTRRFCQDGFLLRQGLLRWVYRHDTAEKRIVVHGICRRTINPFRKIWRYFDQKKAEDLLHTGELYLRRLDLLEDQFEATPTVSMVEAQRRALEHSLGVASKDHLNFYENMRRALFVCCWQKAEHESLQMWRSYCPMKGGFAIQSTQRQLEHQFLQMNQRRTGLYFREIQYVDHSNFNPVSHGFMEQAFLKSTWFMDEKEIRYALFRVDCAAAGRPEQIEIKLAELGDHERLSFDTEAAAENIILNPFASEPDKKAIMALVRSKRPALESRLHRSALESHPVKAI